MRDDLVIGSRCHLSSTVDWDAKNHAKSVGDMSTYVDHFFRDIAGQLSVTICLPKKKPALEIFFPQTECQVLHRHWPSIGGGPTDNCFPKACDDFQVMFPILDLRVKYWSDQGSCRMSA